MLRRAALILIASGLVACSGEPQDAPVDQPPAPTPPVVTPPAPEPDTPVATTEFPEAVPGVFSSQDLAIRVDTAALFVAHRSRDADGRIQLGVAMTFANVGSEPFSIAMTEGGAPQLMLPIGINMDTPLVNGRAEMSGLLQCSSPTDECRIREPARFQEILPGETMTVNMTLEGYFSAAQAASLAGVSRGNFNFRLHYIRGDSIQRPINVSLPNMPIQNQIEN